ncbi:MAG: sulfatase [Lentisphaerales bacterium]|nr:sulfatase [Lentisphaerales bacterium]
MKYVLFFLLLLICGLKADDRPNILFCITDDQSWKHTSFAGDKVVKTPGFDRVAENGIYFENGFTNCPSCAPSRASILTGQSFWRLEEGGLLFGKLKKKFPIFTKLLQDAGYEIGITGKGYSPANQSFDYCWQNIYGKQVNVKMTVPKGIKPVNYAASFEKFVNEKDPNKPFFFWFGASEPHRSYKYGIGKEHKIDPATVTVPSFLPDCEEVRNDIADYYFEIQWQDNHLVQMINFLEKKKMLNNTLIVLTSDNGMPFPRAKATAYNYGVHMPLAMMWGDKIKGGRKVSDFINHEDFAPTFLEVAGLSIPKDMTGKSVVNIFKSDKEGRVDSERSFTVSGLERHVWAREDGKTYGRRVIHTDDFVYIRNYTPDRWPMGPVDFKASHQGVAGDIDKGPSKSVLLKNQSSKFFNLSFGKLPAEELYNIRKDPAQLNNLAGDPEYSGKKDELIKLLENRQKETGDPRVDGLDPWQDYPFYAGTKYLKPEHLEEVKKNKKKK